MSSSGEVNKDEFFGNKSLEGAWKRDAGAGHWSSHGIRRGVKKVTSNKCPSIMGMRKHMKNPMKIHLVALDCILEDPSGN